MLRSHERSRSFRRKKLQFVTTLDLTKCLKHIKEQRLLLTCAPSYELPLIQIPFQYETLILSVLVIRLCIVLIFLCGSFEDMGIFQLFQLSFDGYIEPITKR